MLLEKYKMEELENNMKIEYFRKVKLSGNWEELQIC